MCFTQLRILSVNHGTAKVPEKTGFRTYGETSYFGFSSCASQNSAYVDLSLHHRNFAMLGFTQLRILSVNLGIAKVPERTDFSACQPELGTC